jgi:hypothetical protein
MLQVDVVRASKELEVLEEQVALAETGCFGGTGGSG